MPTLDPGTYTDVFTTLGSGGFVVPDNVTEVVVHVIGGGGGSAGTQSGGIFSSAQTERGAAGGSYARKTLTVTPGQTINFFVGAGGTGGPVSSDSQGTDGEASWAVANNSSGCVAVGGQRSTTSARGIGTTTGCFGDVVYAGGSGGDLGTGAARFSGGGGGGAGTTGPGGDGVIGNQSGNGAGGAGAYQYGGDGGSSYDGDIGAQGARPGQNYGGGACGARSNAGPGQPGAAGAQGVVIFHYTVPADIPKESSDSASMSEGQSLTAAVSSSDPLSVTESAFASTSTEDSDTASFVDSATVSAAHADSDVVGVDEFQQITTDTDDVLIFADDSVGMDESQAVTVSLLDSDTISGTDSEFLNDGELPTSGRLHTVERGAARVHNCARTPRLHYVD